MKGKSWIIVKTIKGKCFLDVRDIIITQDTNEQPKVSFIRDGETIDVISSESILLNKMIKDYETTKKAKEEAKKER